MPEFLGYVRELIFYLEDPIGARVNLTIVGLFALGYLDVFVASARALWEGLQIRRANTALDRGRCPRSDLATVLHFLGLSRRSLLAERLGRLFDLRAAGLAAPDLLRRLTSGRLTRQGALARFIATSLTLIGLFGTVYGLSVAVIKTQLVISQELDLQAMRGLAQALADTMGGMKTAFASTLTGLLTALLLSFGNYLLRRLQSGVAWRLEHFVACRFLPAIEAVDPQMDAAAQIFAEQLRTSAEQLATVGDQVEAASSTYDASAKSWQETSERLATVSTSFTTSFAEGVGELSQLQGRLAQVLTQSSQRIEQVGTSLGEQFDELRSFTAESRQILESQLERLAEQSRSDRQLAEEVGLLTQGLTQTVESLDGRFAGLVQQQQQWLETALEKLDAKVTTQQDRLVDLTAKTLRTQLENLLEKQSKLLEQWVDHQKSGLNGMLGDHHTAFDAMSDLVLDLSQNIDALMQRLETGFPPVNTQPFGGGDHAEL